MRDSSEIGACNGVTPYYLNTGFRLPVSEEWEMAARYRGGDTTNTVQDTIYGTDFSNPADGLFWTRGDSASGAADLHSNSDASSEVAWYGEGMSGSTHPVGGKKANAAGLRDMSGNVIEWCFDLGVSDTRIGRGGDWSHGSADLMIGRKSPMNPGFATDLIGFRIARGE